VAWWVVLIAIGLGAALSIDLVRQALATDQVRWQPMALTPDPAPASPLADAGRPRLIRFTADWCGPCRDLTVNVFSKTDIAETIHARFTPLNVDMTSPTPDQQALAERHGVNYLPTLLIVDADGREIARLEEAPGRQAFRRWLDAGWERWSDTTTLTAEASPRAAPRP